MYKHTKPTFYSNLKAPFKATGGVSPMKNLGQGLGQLFAAGGANRRAKKEQGLADEEFAGAKQDYLNMDFSNPYANMENTMEDLTVNQQAANLAKQQFQQSQSNILDSVQQGGSFNAGNIQALVGAGQQAAAATSADCQCCSFSEWSDAITSWSACQPLDHGPAGRRPSTKSKPKVRADAHEVGPDHERS